MIKKNLLLLIAFVTTTLYLSANIVVDSKLVPYAWTPISDVDKVLEYVNPNDLTKRSTQLINSAKVKYVEGIENMENKEYNAAIMKFKTAMKDYTRSKINDDALNFIRGNMALSYCHTGNKEDLVMAKRLLQQLTSKVYSNSNWMYNVAIAQAKTGNQKEATSLLAQIIRNDEFNFQAYITLEAIYKDSGNQKDAARVRDRMQNAEAKLMRKKQSGSNEVIDEPQEKRVFAPIGSKPDIYNLNIVKDDDHLAFDNVNKINERSMVQIQEGIGEYNKGVKALENKEYSTASTYLKNAEKKLKRGKISEDGLSYTRGNLAIAYLATGDKKNLGQSKRYLKNLTSKIYKTREWTYNLAVAHYEFASRQRSKNAKKEYLDKAIKYLNWSIKQDKLFLTAHENLIFIYKELEEDKKAQSAQNNYEKARKELMRSFSKQEQIAQGGDPYIFRVNLGSYGEFDTPIGLFNQENLIIVPVSDTETSYLAGLFYNLEEAITYQKEMKKSGYRNPFIVAFKDGEKVEF
tara:strand:- start:309 stop:1862 length:1554 start_codon:yes stop_codon:yes gene_type:complete